MAKLKLRRKQRKASLIRKSLRCFSAASRQKSFPLSSRHHVQSIIESHFCFTPILSGVDEPSSGSGEALLLSLFLSHNRKTNIDFMCRYVNIDSKHMFRVAVHMARCFLPRPQTAALFPFQIFSPKTSKNRLALISTSRKINCQRAISQIFSFQLSISLACTSSNQYLINTAADGSSAGIADKKVQSSCLPKKKAHTRGNEVNEPINHFIRRKKKVETLSCRSAERFHE